MYAKSFLARDGQQRLTSALTAQRHGYVKPTGTTAVATAITMVNAIA